MLVAERQDTGNVRSNAQDLGKPRVESPGLRIVRPRDGRLALGLAVSYLMTDPVFARLPFGSWSRVLAGQINRGHCLFALDGERVIGFVGWALTTKEKAEAWLTENRDIGFADSMAGPIVLINGWKAEGREANCALIGALRRLLRDREMVYAKRFYRDGRVRAVRLPLGVGCPDKRATVHQS